MTTYDKNILCLRDRNAVKILLRPEATKAKQYREPVFSKPVKLPTIAAARDFEHVFNEMFGGVV